ncbi:cytochrome c oxidase subunit I [Hydrogenophaga aquatica]
MPSSASAPRDEPLTLTVYDMPDLGSESARRVADTRAGRWKMLMVLLVCAAPVIASYFTYYVVRPEGRRNYGELIEPPVAMPALQAVDLKGQTVPLDSLKDQWLFVSVADSACDAQCERHLYLQRQLREGLGKDKDRLDWVWLRTGSVELSEPLRKATAQAAVLHMDEAAIASWLQPAAGQQLKDHLYVVDPLGQWMMRFPADADPTRMRRDLERLLRASTFWDQAGR